MGENNSNSPGQGTTSQPSGSDTKPQNSAPNNKRKFNKKKGGKDRTNKSSSFAGSMSELNGHVFEVHYETTKINQYTRTCEEIRKYVSRKYEYGGDIATMMEEDREINFDGLKPKYPEPKEGATVTSDKDGIDPTDKRIWERECDNFVKRRDYYRQHKVALFMIIWGQCSDTMQAKLKTIKTFEKIEKSRDRLGLLREIKAISYDFESDRCPYESAFDALCGFYQMRQHRHQTNAEYLTKFKNVINVLNHYKISIGEDPLLVNEVANRDRKDDESYQDIARGSQSFNEHLPTARNRLIAYAFLRGACTHRYSKLVRSLSNQYNLGNCQYPDTLAFAYGMLVNYKSDKKKSAQPSSNEENAEDPEMSFLNADQNDNNSKLNNSEGYSSSSDNSTNSACNLDRNTAVTLLLAGTDDDPHGTRLDGFDDPYDFDYSYMNVGSVQDDDDETIVSLAHLDPKLPYLNSNWILLDNQSTVHIFRTPSLVTNIHNVTTGEGLTCHSNGGSQRTTKKATYGDFGSVWFNPSFLVNILSFALVVDDFVVEYVQKSDRFIITMNDGSIMPFIRSPRGLCYHDITWKQSESHAHIFVNTVEDNMRLFTPRQVRNAERARELYILMGRPSARTFKYMLQHGLIQNTTVTYDDAFRAEQIFGSDLGALKGKSVRTAPVPVVLPTVIPIPQAIFTSHRDVTLSGDIFYMDKSMFFLTISRNLQFLTVHHIQNKKHDTIWKCICQASNLYKHRGFHIKHLLTDHEFQPLEARLLSIDICLNATAASEHSPEIERSIRVIKERARSFIVLLPFSHLPRLIKQHLIHYLVSMINLTIHPNSVSPFLSPATIVTGISLNVDVHCRLQFCSYCQVVDEPKPTNSVHKPRTLDALALRPMGNVQGGYLFIHLDTWSIIKRRKWTVLPMPSSVITIVNKQAISESQPTTTDSLVFTRRNKSTITSLHIDDSHLLPAMFEDEGATANISASNPDNDDNNIDVAGPLTSTVTQGAPGFKEGAQDTPSMNQGALVSADGHTDTEESSDEMSVDDHNANDQVKNPPSNDTFSIHSMNTSEQYDEINESHDSDTSIDSDSTPCTDDDLSTPTNHDDDVPSEPVDNLQAVMQSSLSPDPITDVTDTSVNTASIPISPPQQRNASAKNNILSEITEENIIHSEPDDRPSTHRYSMRRKVNPKQPGNYDSKFGFTFFHMATRDDIQPKPPTQFFSRYGYAFHQMSAREGLKLFGDRAANALIDEWVQLDQLGVFEGAYFHLLTPEQRKEALRLVQLIKEKRCGRIKCRTCADGRKQRKYILPEDATSPTVSSDAVLLSCMWDVHEGRFVATADVPGAFLHSDMIELVYVVVDGVLVDMLIQSNPKYKKFVHTTRDGKRLVYLKLRKALYGTVTAARLFFENITDKLTK